MNTQVSQDIVDYGRLDWSEENQGWYGRFFPDNAPEFFVYPRQSAPEGRKYDRVNFSHVNIKHRPANGEDVAFDVAAWKANDRIMLKGKGSRKFGDYLKSQIQAIATLQPDFLPEV